MILREFAGIGSTCMYSQLKLESKESPLYSASMCLRVRLSSSLFILLGFPVSSDWSLRSSPLAP